MTEEGTILAIPDAAIPDAPSVGVIQDASGTQPQGGDGQGSAFYVLNYKSREEAEKGFREKEQAVGRAFAERDKANDRVNELTATIQKLALGASGNPATASKPPPNRQSVVKEIDDRGGDAVVEVFERMDEIQAARIAEVERKDAERLASLEARLKDLDPEYIQRKEQIQQLGTRLKLDPAQHRDTLLEFAKIVEESQTGRPSIPGNMGTPVQSISTAQVKVNPTHVAFLEAVPNIGKLDPAEVKTLFAASKKRRTA